MSSELHPSVKLGIAIEEALSRVPSFDAASVRRNGDGYLIEARLSTSSRMTKMKRNFTQEYLLDSNLNLLQTSDLKVVPDDVKLSSTSPNGNLTVRLRALEGQDIPSRIIEVTSREEGVLAEIDVSDTHAAFLSGSTWGSPSWNSLLSQDKQDVMVYVAEQHPDHWKEKDKPYSFYEYQPNFGEQLYKATRPGIFVLDLSNVNEPRVIPVKSLDDSTHYMQPVIHEVTEDQIELYATGVSLAGDGRRLGQIYCTNRPSSIYRVRVPRDTSASKEVQIDRITETDKGRSCRSPRIFDGKIWYLSNRTGYEHNSCAKLHSKDLKNPDAPSSTIVDQIDEPKAAHKDDNDPFPGLYLDSLPERPFLRATGKAATAVLSSQWRSMSRCLSISLDDGRVTCHADDPLASTSVLGTDGQSVIVGVTSTLTELPRLAVGRLVNEGKDNISKGDAQVEWTTVKQWKPCMPDDIEVPRLYTSLTTLSTHQPTEVVILTPYKPKEKQVSSAISESTVFTSDGAPSGVPPVVLSPHGGPNGVVSTAWSATSFANAAAGFTLAFVNYPGSIGFGQKPIEQLSAACGELDVRACKAALDHLLEIGMAVNSKGKRMVAGGSHGGFITGHLTSRWPDMFDAAIMRNPVVDLPSCFATSDIPDWSLAQFNLPYDFDNPPSFVPSEHLEKLKKASPSYHLTELFKSRQDKKQTCMPPTLLVLGTDDLRVPPSQGKAWYHALKGHGEEAKMLLFPENGHPIETVWAGKKNFAGSLEFLVKHATL